MVDASLSKRHQNTFDSGPVAPQPPPGGSIWHDFPRFSTILLDLPRPTSRVNPFGPRLSTFDPRQALYPLFKEQSSTPKLLNPKTLMWITGRARLSSLSSIAFAKEGCAPLLPPVTWPMTPPVSSHGKSCHNPFRCQDKIKNILTLTVSGNLNPNLNLSLSPSLEQTSYDNISLNVSCSPYSYLL